jgi:hypothetical protein
MSDLIIIDGDTVMFQPSFGAATLVPPGPMTGTISGSAATTQITSKAPCLEGDETKVSVPCSYMAGSFLGGTGNLKIDKLNSDQLTKTTTFEGKKVILKGSTFDAVLEVTKQAQDSSLSPDGMTKYSGGKGSFVASNQVIFAS